MTPTPRSRRSFLAASFVGLAAATLLASAPARAAKVGEAAPEFTATDSNGKSVKLSQWQGKIVVLEWHNQDCPFVVKHYKSGNMQKLQKEWTGKGVVWVSIISSAPGKQGHVDGTGANLDVEKHKAAPSVTLLDPKGEIGRLYGAKTTPHMFVIGKDGRLLYNGAIDDKPTADQADLAAAKNYVSLALTEVLAGKPVSTPTTTPYGCSVKY
jgi:peroxiredoxin